MEMFHTETTNLDFFEDETKKNQDMTSLDIFLFFLKENYKTKLLEKI